jgi:nucleotide-binding universal stress UspA family protein
MKRVCPGTRILVPVDGSEHANRSVQFTGCLGTSLSKAPQEVTLLRVLTGRYMSSRLPYLDFRAEILKQSDVFTKFKQRYIETDIMPSLEKDELMLRNTGITSQITRQIAEGDPAREIIRTAQEGNFTTIIMARRGLSEFMGVLLGSVTNKVVLSAVGQTVYIVGQKVLEENKCPVPKILVPIDGSKYSLRGIEHAACLARELKQNIGAITLLRVINLAFYETRLLEGIDPEEETKKIFQEAQKTFAEFSMTEGLVTTKMRVGRPAEEIMKEAEEGKYNLIIMGRKGRTALKNLILGGVSTTVIQRCMDPTIAIVSMK